MPDAVLRTPSAIVPTVFPSLIMPIARPGTPPAAIKGFRSVVAFFLTGRGALVRQAPIRVRDAADVVHEVGRHGAGALASQGQRVDEPAEAFGDRADDLVV